MAYNTFGDPAAPPILSMMGLAAQMIAWDDEFCAMADRGYYVIRFDNRDIGLSTKFHEHGVPNVVALLQNAMAGKPVSASYLLRGRAAHRTLTRSAL